VRGLHGALAVLVAGGDKNFAAPIRKATLTEFDRERGKNHYGPATEALLASFQEKQGLKATGALDEDTAKRLGIAAAEPQVGTADQPAPEPQSPFAPPLPAGVKLDDDTRKPIADKSIGDTPPLPERLRPATEGKASLGDALRISARLSGGAMSALIPADDAKAKTLVGVLDTLSPEAPAFKATLQSIGLTADAIADAGRAVRLAALADGNPALMAGLREKAGDDADGRLTALAALDHAAMLAMVTKEAGLSGRDAAIQARTIIDRIEQAQPEAAFAARLHANELLAGHAGRDDVVAFLAQNPGFKLGSSLRFASAEARKNLSFAGIENRERAIAAVDAVSQLSALGFTLSQIAALQSAGLADAAAILDVNAETLHRVLERVPGNSLDLTQVQNLRVGLDAAAARGAALGLNLRLPFAGTAAGPTRRSLDRIGGAQIPGIRSLLGSIDGCTCGHCMSALGLPAYFADLMQFIRRNPDEALLRPDGSIDRSASRAFGELMRRRPDLEHLALTCANASAEVSHIALVNELLEGQLGNTPAEAYGKLANAGPDAYPWSMPFDLNLEETRAYAQRSGISRLKLMAALAPDAIYSSRKIAAEWLGLSRGEADMLTTRRSARELRLSWGLATDASDRTAIIDRVANQEVSGTVHEVLGNLSLLMQQAHATLPELINALESRHVGLVPAGTRLPLVSDTPCDFASLRFDGLNDDRLERLQRFLRLRRALGWNAADLDAVLHAASTIAGGSDDQLVAVALIDQLAKRLSLPREIVAAWWGGIATTPTRDNGNDAVTITGSLYERLLLDGRQGEGSNAALAALADPGVSDRGPLEDSIRAVAAAFGVAAEDIALLTNATTDMPPFVDNRLSRETLARILGWTGLASGLNVSLADAVAFARALALDPLQSPAAALGYLDRVSRLIRLGLTAADMRYLFLGEPPAGVTRETEEAAVALLVANAAAAAVAPVELAGSGLPQANASRATPGTLNALRTDAAVRALASGLAIDSVIVGDLVKRVWPVDAPSQSEAIADALTRAPSDLPMTRAQRPVAFSVVTRLRRLAHLMHRIGITPELYAVTSLDTRHALGADIGRTDQLPDTYEGGRSTAYSSIERLIDLAQLAKTVPNAPALLQSHFAALSISGDDAARMAAAAAMAAAFATSSDEAARAGARVGIAPTESIKFYRAPAKLAAWCQLLGLLDAAGLSLADADSLTAERPDATAPALARRMLQKRLPGEQSAAAISGIEPALARRRRDVLVDYAMVTLKLPDANAVYEHFLIDTEMAPCFKTTRMLAAIASLQLFVQRCLLSLEGDIRLGDSQRRRWQWMKSYRVWEANRKVLLFPENWLFAELRDDKSDQFRALESALAQAEPGEESARNALSDYIDGLKQVSEIAITGLFQDDDSAHTLYVVGRSRNPPFRHFWRACRGYGGDHPEWMAWRSLPQDLTSEHMLPFVMNGEFHIAWPVIAKVDKNNSHDGKPDYAWQTKIAWSRYNNGRWSATEHSKDSVETPVSPGRDERSSFHFRVDIESSAGAEKALVGMFAYPGQPSPASTPRMASRNEPHSAEVRFIGGGAPVGGSYPCSRVNLRARGWSRFTDPATHDVFVIPDDSPTSFALSLGNLKRLPSGHLVGNSGAAMTVVRNLPYPTSGMWSTTFDVVFVDGASGRNQGGILQSMTLPCSFERQVRDGLGRIERAVSAIYQLPLLPNRTYDIDIEAISDVSWPPPKWANDEDAIVDLRERYVFVIAEGQPAAAIAGNGASLPQKVVQAYTSNFRERYTRDPVDLLPVRIGNEGAAHDPVTEKIVFPRTTTGRYTMAVAGRSPGAGARSATLAFDEQEASCLVDIEYARNSFRYSPSGMPWTRTARRAARAGLGALFSVTNQSIGMGEGDIARLTDQNVAVDATTRFAADTVTFRSDEVQFRSDVANAIYAWELYLHVPLLVAEHFLRHQRFAEAQRWLNFVFDPTASGTGGNERFWGVLPFRKAARGETLTAAFEELARSLAAPDRASAPFGRSPSATALAALVERWKDAPFEPFLIARDRPAAFQWRAVFLYLDILIAWGDDLFARGTRETVNEATMLYVLAASILGPRARKALPAEPSAPQTYAALKDRFDEMTNALIDLGTQRTFVGIGARRVFGQFHSAAFNALGTMPTGGHLLFCLPDNPKLDDYAHTLDDRLFKIRNCRDITGNIRETPLLDPPIDVALLVRARAAGVDIGEVLRDIDAPRPIYRYAVLAQKAADLANEVRMLGDQLAAALEKRDAEKLARLRASQDFGLMRQSRDTKARQIDEAAAALEALSASRDMAAARLAHYHALLGKANGPSAAAGAATALLPSTVSGVISPTGDQDLPLIGGEASQLTQMRAAQDATTAAGAASLAAAQTSLISAAAAAEPTGAVHKVADIVGQALGFVIAATRFSGDLASGRSAQAGLLASHQRRRDEWVMLANQAAREIGQIDKQIIAAELRIAIARSELANHDRARDNASEAYDFLKSKFTNSELYEWLVSELSTIYFDAYRMARRMALAAERAAESELGDRALGIIGLQHWDKLKSGLLAGQRLQHDLKRLDTVFLERNRRELEITKHVSLASIAPHALWELKTGAQRACSFVLPEMLFDIDFPGHFQRRLKSVALSIPCVVGPYASINAVLALEQSSIRIEAATDPQYAAGNANDARFLVNHDRQSVVISSGIVDSGLFELNLRDDRYLPFEGHGVADSRWELSLPSVLPGFDVRTITDVVLHLRYTARDGDEPLRTAAKTNVGEKLAELTLTGETAGFGRLLSVRADFPDLWREIQRGATHFRDSALDPKRHLPFAFGTTSVEIASCTFYRESLNGTASVIYTGDPAGRTLPFSSITTAKLGNVADISDILVLVRYVVGSRPPSG
jgi:peptidoglycan hydrolase-like protein with peptidoglycan-binding domain